MKNNKKYMTTYWMDLLTYIVIPFITVVATVRVVRSLLYSTFSLGFFGALFIEVAFIILYVLTFFNSHRRTKFAYTCFRILIIATAIRAAIDFALTDVSGYHGVLAFVGYLALAIALWVYPNEKYFKNRKDLFRN